MIRAGMRGEAAARPGHDPRHLRHAFGHFATGVCVVATTAPDGTRIGATVNSLTSLSLDPALLLVCVARSMRAHDALVAADGFAVSVLDRSQEELSRIFARAGADKWQGVAAEPGAAGGLILTPHLAYFDCETHARHEGGDHTILVGRIAAYATRPEREPLLYFQGRYHGLPAAVAGDL